MRMIEYLYTGMLFIALVLIYFAFNQYSKTDKLLSNGVKTSAVVIDLIESRDSDGSTYLPIFEYTDRTDTKVAFKNGISSNPSPYQIGDKVKIIYSKNTDDKKVISFWGLYRWTILLLSIASPLLIIGGGYLLYNKG